MRLVGLVKQHKWLLLIFFVFLMVHLWFLVVHPGSIFNEPERFGEEISIYGSRDASLYAKMAWQIINDGIYGYNSETSNAYVTPGQPFYLVIIFKTAELLKTNHVMLTRLANMILNVMTMLLTYFVVLKLFSNRGLALGTAVLYCLHIAPYHYFRTALTEIPSLFLFMLSIAIFLIALEKRQYRYHLLFGLIASVLLMFRPTPAPILLLAWGIVLYQNGFKEGVKIGFIWSIGPLFIMVPWVIRNFMIFNHFYLFSSHAGGPLLAGTNAFYLIDQAVLVREAEVKGLLAEDYAKERLVKGFLENFPLYFAWFTVGKTLWLFMDQSGFPDGLGPYRGMFPGWLQYFFTLQNIGVVFIAFLSIILFHKKRPILLLSLVIVIYIIFSNIFLTLPRYGLLIYPIMCIIAATGIYEIVERIKQKKNTSQ